MLDRPAIIEPTLADVIREIRELRTLIEAHYGLAPVDDADETLSTFQVCKLTGRSRQCVVNWAKRFAIGDYDGARTRWGISRTRLVEFCKAHPDASRRVFW